MAVKKSPWLNRTFPKSITSTNQSLEAQENAGSYQGTGFSRAVRMLDF
jgi:hypothetical protein